MFFLFGLDVRVCCIRTFGGSGGQEFVGLEGFEPARRDFPKWL